ncbi:unnamed protein product [Porites evermanni]|uniref:cardiolipin synthase (CMP-forming) n=1 Tax=Porites evermanni TaxID=104178 RepID=A0ABN8N9X1_9CNID|nr:unnamed protein product [Porites evermanni]
MAGACSICQALRLNSALTKCLRFRYFPPKLKYAVPAAFLSSVGFLGSQRSTESSVSASLLSETKHSPMCCLGSRSFRTTAVQRERASQESDDVKTGSKKIKAKLEQMKEMREDIFTIPNLLSTLRILATPVLGYLVITEDFVSSLALFGVAGITDMLDGFIARNFKNQKSVLGTILDPLADKILMSVLTVSLTLVSLLPVPLTALILSRDALLIGYAFYLRFKSLPSPKSISRYFDINFPTVELRPNLLGKTNTVLQLALVGCSLSAPVFGFVDHLYLHYLWYTVACSTVMSSISYVVNIKESVKYLK